MTDDTQRVEDKPYSRNIELKPGMEFPSGMTRWALGVEYSGTNYRGFQKQSGTPETVQGYLERALSKVANEAITLVCAGRTDAGVHAAAQVIHFDTLAARPSKAWVQGVNTHLPDSIRIHWAHDAGCQFHARFSALSRSYRYVLHSAPVRSAVLQKHVTWLSDELNLPAMQSAVVDLLGEHDFSAFRAAQCQAHSPVREITDIKITEHASFLVLEVTANAFLHHMVRNIVGSALEVGRGRKASSWLQELLHQKDRRLAAATAPPHGLYLVHVGYPSCFGLPEAKLGPLFLNCG